MKSKYGSYKSFAGKVRVSLSLSAIIPYLMVIYLFVYEKIDLTDTIILFSSLALMSIFTGFSLMRRSAAQLVTLARETGMVEIGEKSEPVLIMGDEEMNDIAAHFNSIFKRLQRVDKDIREQGVQLLSYARDFSLSYEKTKKEEGLRNRLSKYVGNDLVEKLIISNNGAFLKSVKKEVTILYADIRSFTTLSERMTAEELVSMLNQFFGIMVDIVFRNNGALDKFIGDQLMAVFGFVSS